MNPAWTSTLLASLITTPPKSSLAIAQHVLEEHTTRSSAANVLCITGCPHPITESNMSSSQGSSSTVQQLPPPPSAAGPSYISAEPSSYTSGSQGEKRPRSSPDASSSRDRNRRVSTNAGDQDEVEEEDKKPSKRTLSGASSGLTSEPFPQFSD